MKHPDPLFSSLQQMMIDLSLINRYHYLAGTDRRENDIEHSMTVALLCWYIHDKNKLDLSLEKILKYAMTHDFVERYAGDVNAYASKSEREAKVIREQSSLTRLSREYEDFPDMVQTMHQYELKQDEESLFVWTVDKMQTLIMGDLDNWRLYQEIEISYEQFSTKNSELLAGASQYCSVVFDSLIKYSQATYYDRPETEV